MAGMEYLKQLVDTYQPNEETACKAGKRQETMKKFGSVEIPSEAFTVMLRRDSCILKI